VILSDRDDHASQVADGPLKGRTVTQLLEQFPEQLPIGQLSSPQFGQATMMLDNYLGSGGQSGGLNPLYQIGSPRSVQLALKLQF
jgi:hypothetical protein